MWFVSPPIQYEQPVYRPPSEGQSLLIQVTIGCSHNFCTYCDMYRSKNYRVRSFEEVDRDLCEAKKHYARLGVEPKRIFFCDGDALAAPTEFLAKCLGRVNELFPNLERVGVYATAMNMLEKSEPELKLLNQKGLKIVYLGMESGSDEVLKKIVKGNTADEMIEASLKIKRNGYLLSTIVMIGVGGKELSLVHQKETARLLSETAPHYLSFLVTSPVEGTPYEKMLNNGHIHLPNEREMLVEMKGILEQLSDDLTNSIIFRANHVSNQVPLAGTFPDDRRKLISILCKWIKEMPEITRGSRKGHM